MSTFFKERRIVNHIQATRGFSSSLPYANSYFVTWGWSVSLNTTSLVVVDVERKKKNELLSVFYAKSLLVRVMGDSQKTYGKKKMNLPLPSFFRPSSLLALNLWRNQLLITWAKKLAC